MQNATLPHLNIHELKLAIRAMASRIRPGGLLLVSIRDYDALIAERPTMQAPAFYGKGGDRRIVHQVLDWTAQDRYIVHLSITVQTGLGWTVRHFVSEYRCLLRDELSSLLRAIKFTNAKWIMPGRVVFTNRFCWRSKTDTNPRAAVYRRHIPEWKPSIAHDQQFGNDPVSRPHGPGSKVA